MCEAPPVAALTRLYGNEAADRTFRQLSALMPERPFTSTAPTSGRTPLIWLLAYPKHVRSPSRAGLQDLAVVLDSCNGVFEHVHILPPFLSAADFGFAPSDHYELDPDAGTWADLEDLSQKARLSIDIILNHVAPEHPWARAVLQSRDPAALDPFIAIDPASDFSALAQSRHHPPVTAYSTPRGTRHYWTRYGPDQMDLDYRKPAVLAAIAGVMVEYARRGIQGLRLDALAFLWKDVDRKSANEPEVFEILTVLRWVADRCGIAELIAEGDVRRGQSEYVTPDDLRATIAYRYESAPIVLTTLLREDNRTFVKWLQDQHESLHKTRALNFLSTHDGVYLRSTDSPIDADDLDLLVRRTEERGGTVVWRESEGTNKPYELDIAIVDLLGGGPKAADKLIAGLMLICWLPGIPMVYLGHLFGIDNDDALVDQTGDERARNRGTVGSTAARQSLQNGIAARVMAALKGFKSEATSYDAFAADSPVLPGPDLGPHVVSLIRRGKTSALLCLLALGRRTQLRLPAEWTNEGEAEFTLEPWAFVTVARGRRRRE